MRFTSPHPRDFTDDVIDAMASTPNVMPQLHMPHAVRLRRRLAARCAVHTGAKSTWASSTACGRRCPNAAITTDIIVGFPGETDEDFEQTLDVVRAGAVCELLHVPVLQATGTPAADMDGQIPASVVRERYERLVAVADEVAWDSAKEQVGRVVDVLVAEGEGRKDDQTHRMSGRAADNRLVHFVAADARPGDMVSVEVTYAAPHHLVADVVHGVRRTRAGDAWESRQEHGRTPARRRPTRYAGVPLGRVIAWSAIWKIRDVPSRHFCLREREMLEHGSSFTG